MTAATVLLGLLLGSFLNVCIARLPRHESVAWPGSHCPHCARPIRPWDNLPLLSFLVLRGRCRDCHLPIAWRYPLVEVLVPLLFVLAGRYFPLPLAFVEAATLCFLLVGLAAMDLESFRLPDAFTLPGMALGLLGALLPGGGLGAASQVHFPFPVLQFPPAVSSLIAAAGASGLLLLFRWLYHLLRKKEGLGLGDVKLAGLLGAWLGVSGAVLTLALGVLLAACAGLVLIAAKRPARQLPLGAFLALAGVITLFLKAPLLQWYFSFWL